MKMPMWVLLDIKESGKIGIWHSTHPFPNGASRYEFPSSSVAGKTIPQALRNLAKELEVKEGK